MLMRSDKYEDEDYKKMEYYCNESNEILNQLIHVSPFTSEQL